MREGKPGHDISSLSQAEKEKAAEREIAMINQAKKTSTRKPRFAEGTAPDARAANEQLQRAKSVLPEDDFSDQEVTQVFESKPSRSIHDEDTQIIRLRPSTEKDEDISGIMEGLRKAGAAAEAEKKPKSSKKEKKPAMIVMDAEDHKEAAEGRRKTTRAERDRADAEQMAKAVEDAQQEAKEVADIKEMRRTGFEKPPTKDMQDESEEVADLKSIRESLSAKKSKAETDNIKNVREKISGVGVKKPASKVEISGQYLQEIADMGRMEAQDVADKAQAAYAKAYTEYDPKFRAKLVKDNKSGDALSNYDLIAVTRPPRLAFLTSKGRELNRLYKDLQEKIKATGKEQ